MKLMHVDGEKKKSIVLFALSTCGWCRKAKTLLGELGIGYDYVNVDELAGEDRTDALEQLKKWNPRCSFPSMVIDDSSCLIGYDEDKIKGALGL